MKKYTGGAMAILLSVLLFCTGAEFKQLWLVVSGLLVAGAWGLHHPRGVAG